MAVDYFLKLDGIDGESTDAKHKGDIEVESWSWGETQTGTMARGGGGGAGKVDMQDFHFTMRVNKASPTLMLNCASGKHIPKATLVCRKAGGNQEEFLKLNFSDILISSYQTGGSNGADVPMDQISLNFAKVEYEYMTQDAKGKTGSPVKVGWDLSKNVKV